MTQRAEGVSCTPLSASARWSIVIAACVAQIVGMGPLLQFTFSVFLLPIGAEFQASRGAISGALTSGLLTAGLCIPFAGILIDRFNPKIVTTTAAVFFAGGLVALGLLPATLTQFTVIFVLTGAVSALQTPLVYTKVIARHFDRDRGLALGIALMGVGIGTILMPQFAQRLIDAVAWRGAYVGLGVALLVVGVPAILFCMRFESRGTSSDVAPALVGLSVREAMVDTKFWRVAVCFFLAAASSNGILAHIVPMAELAAFEAGSAVRLISVAGLASIFGRVLAGALADRFHAAIVSAAFFMLIACGIGLLLAGSLQPVNWYLAVLGIGLGIGAEAHLIGFLLSRYCGQRAFGQLFGIAFGGFILASSLGPFLMGVWFSRSGSYTGAMVLLLAALLVASLTVVSLGGYTYPIRKPSN